MWAQYKATRLNLITILFLKKILIFTITLSGCTKTEDYLRDKVKKHSDLIDPPSAIFRNITYKKSIAETWCGEINEKNRMGEYTGWKPFNVLVHDDGSVSVTILNPERVTNSFLLQYNIDKLNFLILDIYNNNCKDTKPASSSVPFWKNL